MEDGEGTGGEGADEQGADKAGGIGDGNGVDIVPGAVCVGQCLVDNGVDDFDMAPGRDLWYDTAVLGVDVDLGVDDIAQKPTAVFDNRGCCLVATALNTKYFHYC